MPIFLPIFKMINESIFNRNYSGLNTQTISIPEEVEQILLGSLLGDGSLQKGKNGMYAGQENHSIFINLLGVLNDG